MGFTGGKTVALPNVSGVAEMKCQKQEEKWEKMDAAALRRDLCKTVPRQIAAEIIEAESDWETESELSDANYYGNAFTKMTLKAGDFPARLVQWEIR